MADGQAGLQETAEKAAAGESGGRLSGPALAAAFAALRERRGPGLRPRDAADALGVSEGELVASQVGAGVVRLKDDPRAILADAPRLGAVKVITRNEHCVHEKIGVFDHVSFGGAMGLVVNHDIDLRLFMGHWRSAFAVPSVGADGVTRQSLQFFDADGTAMHKIFCMPGADPAPFDALVAAHAAPEQRPELAVLPLPPRAPDRPDDAVNTDGLIAHWRALQDTHDFFGMLREFGVGREQAFRLAPDDLAAPLASNVLDRLLPEAASDGVSIMVFVGNPGCIQIHTGPIENVFARGPWLNVMDPTFDLHLRRDRVARAWRVRKPTADGIVTSVELFDAEGFCFCQLFGERKPGIPERSDWRDLVAAHAP